MTLKKDELKIYVSKYRKDFIWKKKGCMRNNEIILLNRDEFL